LCFSLMVFLLLILVLHWFNFFSFRFIFSHFGRCSFPMFGIRSFVGEYD
jgi:hypothetical protein